MAKMKMEFDGFEEVISRLKSLEGDVNKVTEKALKETHRIVTDNAEKAIATNKRTGQTEKSLVKKSTVTWSSSVAEVEVGFNIRQGGLASIFLMYGTPKMKKDQKLYNAFYGSATRRKVKEAQEDIFYDEIRRLNG